MNTFLKVFLFAILIVVAIKLSPVLLAALFVGMLAAVILGAVGISLIVATLAVLIAFAVSLSPIWIPVLAIIGIISLFKRNGSTPTAPTPPAVAA